VGIIYMNIKKRRCLFLKRLICLLEMIAEATILILIAIIMLPVRLLQRFTLKYF